MLHHGSSVGTLNLPTKRVPGSTTRRSPHSANPRTAPPPIARSQAREPLRQLPGFGSRKPRARSETWRCLPSAGASGFHPINGQAPNQRTGTQSTDRHPINGQAPDQQASAQAPKRRRPETGDRNRTAKLDGRIGSSPLYNSITTAKMETLHPRTQRGGAELVRAASQRQDHRDRVRRAHRPLRRGAVHPRRACPRRPLSPRPSCGIPRERAVAWEHWADCAFHRVR